MNINFDGFYRLVIYNKITNKYYEQNNGYVGYNSDLSKNYWTNKSQHRIASVTKLFTIISILILLQNNKLSLHNTINLYDINIPYANKIKILHLLLHSSGIFNSVNYFCDYDLPFVKDIIMDNLDNNYHYKNPDIDTIIKGINNSKWAYDMLGSSHDTENNKCFYPGTDFRYNNTGYLLLGYIIYKITNVYPSEFIKKNILEPLSMDDTVFHSNYAHKCVQILDSRSNICYYNDFDNMGIHANMISTTDDLLKFALCYTKLLNNHTKKLFHSIIHSYWKNLNKNINDNFIVFHNGSIDFPPYFDEKTPSESFFLINDVYIIIAFGNKRDGNKKSISDILFDIYLRK